MDIEEVRNTVRERMKDAGVHEENWNKAIDDALSIDELHELNYMLSVVKAWHTGDEIIL